MADDATVTFTTDAGTRVTVSRESAERIGYKTGSSAKKATSSTPAKKAAGSSEPSDSESK